MLTGSDYLASFSRRGKVAPLKKLKKNESCLTALWYLGHSEYISYFFCQMIDAVRLELFCNEISTEQRETSSYANNLLSNIFPLCQRILQEKINRTNFTGAKWRSSTKSIMLSFNPVNCDWAIEGGK